MKKPTGPVEIDWDNPLTRGLRVYILGDNRSIDNVRNLADKSHWAQAGTGNIAVGWSDAVNAVGSRWTAQTYNFTNVNSTTPDEWFQSDDKKPFDEVTVVYIGTWGYTGSLTYDELLSKGSTFASGTNFSFGHRNGNMYFWSRSGGGTLSGDEGGGMGTNIAATWTKGGVITKWVDGKVVRTDTGNTLYAESTNNLTFGGTTAASSTARGWTGNAAVLIAFDRALPKDEVEALSASPYQILRPAIPAFAFGVQGTSPGADVDNWIREDNGDWVREDGGVWLLEGVAAPAGVVPLGHHRLDNQYAAIAASRLNGVLQ